VKKEQNIFYPLFLICFIVIAGVLGFMLIEGYSFFDALYMTIITITTIGYAEVHELSTAGRVFNIFLIVAGFATFAYAIAKLTQYIVDGEIRKYFKHRKIMSAVNHLENHVIVCGYGRNGKQACHTLTHHKEQFVVIEKSEEKVEGDEFDKSTLYVKGDATDDDVLIRAGIKRAKALLTVLPDDADNVFIVLSARALNDKIQIISRASNSGSVPKLKKAGANSVIMPDKIGGTHMATLVTKPDIIEFIDYLSGEEGDSINLESINFDMLPKELQGRTLKEIMASQKSLVSCIGVKDSEGKFIINPPGTMTINKSMKIIVLGTSENIKNAQMSVSWNISKGN
jgi:voltage-gated potassium channel